MAYNKYDTVIVGGGIAGLTAAAYLARGGQKVVLIEKNKECGGLVNTFSRNGFHFDAGVRALEDAGIILPMLNDLGIELEFLKSPVSLGVENKIIHIDGLESLAQYQEMLAGLFPDAEDDIAEILRNIRRSMKDMEVLYGIENPLFKDMKRDRAFIFRKLLPWLPRFIFTVRKINRMNLPVEEYLKTIVKDQSLRDIVSQHFFKNTPTFFAMSYFSLYLDYIYPKGGVGKLAEAVKDKILAYGGEIRSGTRITEVNADQCRVVDEQRVSYAYDQLIWAADLKTFYRMAETEGLQPEIIAKFQDEKGKMLEHRGGDSVFTLFIEVDEPVESFRKIAHGHFFYTPSKQGLGDTHWKELDQLLENWETAGKEEVLAWLGKFTSLNTYEISAPGLKDPGMAPEGKTGLIISLLAEYDLFRKARESGWYDEFVAAFESQIIKVISQSVYPMLKDRVISHFSFSPLSIENRVGSSEGAITGWSFQDPLPVIHKIHIADRSVLTPIPNIYQAGQWAYSPAGVPMSILTGKITADKVMKKKKKHSV